MTLTITLDPSTEAQLRAKAEANGQDINTLATQLLSALLAWVAQETEATTAGIQQGLEDFEAGRFRDFDEFVIEQQQKYELPGLS
jgi:predicted transcriptional regulator